MRDLLFLLDGLGSGVLGRAYELPEAVTPDAALAWAERQAWAFHTWRSEHFPTVAELEQEALFQRVLQTAGAARA